MNIKKILLDTLNVDINQFVDFKIDGSHGLLLFRGRMQNGAVVVKRFYQRDDYLVPYTDHKYFEKSVRNGLIQALHQTDFPTNTIAQMMNLSVAMVNRLLKEFQDEEALQ